MNNKKILSIALTATLSLTLVACSNEGKNNTTQNTVTNNLTTKINSEEKINNSNTFEDDTAKVVIKNYEFLKSQYDENVQIVALTIEFTNKSDEAIDPWFGSPTKAEQETDKTIELLDGANGLFPEDYKPELVNASDVKVKPGATVEAVIGYELKINNSPVYIRDWDGHYEYLLEQAK